ncbi:DUF6340 family protein [Arenibacter sp. GZD96]|uniref:DUF6340 family protein n=1 Tax=Aurantibrevibacter litoralis TaxID=3106030 RepID=UPI002AFDD2AC|nr:DUF6340 family protein [Arenibacter sp. GZD-96]MEA1785937.1 DUF6340 family protein [Arenibacter sp. GZD-96]
MKNYSIQYLVIVLTLMLMGCSATNQLRLSVVEPAPVFIPNDVKKVGIINRSLPSKGKKAIDRIEQILTAEGLYLDLQGSETAITALRDQLIREQRFDKVIVIDSLTHEKSGLGVLPASLSWEAVDALCTTHGVDVLFSLEYFDTDTAIDYQLTTMKLPNTIGIVVDVPAHQATLNTVLNNGWRIYDPYHKDVLDEYLASRHIVSVGKGINPIKAVEAVLGRKEAVLQESTYLGSQYAMRIFPYKNRVTRNYFVRGSTNFEMAKRRAQTGDWDGAALLWQKELSNKNAKIAGRANYNMAISHEINGDLDKAMVWASKSYTDYKNKEALRYLQILKYRASQNEELQYQVKR